MAAGRSWRTRQSARAPPVMSTSQHAALVDRASRPYRSAGRFAYQFARGKLSADPVYRAIFELGLLLGRGRILDLGCGQGLLSAWLQAALKDQESGRWPQTWPPVPTPRSTRGIELMTKDVERARQALGDACEISQGDIRTAEFGMADAVVIFDVLHYITAEDQLKVLQRVRSCLPVRGLLLLRIGDAGGGLRFRYSQWVDKLVMLFRGHSLVKTHCRNVAQWCALLNDCGFEVQATPMSEGTQFANVLLIAHAL
jgi:SAM-dependent methyltransferase